MNATRADGRRTDRDEPLDGAETWIGHEGRRLTADQVRTVLDERAKTLAQVPARSPDAAEVLELATFSLGSERYAIETCFVRRITRLGHYTPVPGVSDLLLGVTNVGGEILAVFDFRILVGGVRQETTDQTRILVLGADHEEFGILADAAHEVLVLRHDDLFAPPGSLDGAARHLLRGVTADALIVVDGEALLRDQRLVIDQGDESSGR